MPQQPSPTIPLHCHSHNGTLCSYTSTTDGSSATYSAVRVCSPHIAHSQRVGPAASQPAPTYAAALPPASGTQPQPSLPSAAGQSSSLLHTRSQLGRSPYRTSSVEYISFPENYNCNETTFENVAHSKHQEFLIICTILGFRTPLLAIVKPSQFFFGLHFVS